MTTELLGCSVVIGEPNIFVVDILPDDMKDDLDDIEDYLAKLEKENPGKVK